MIPQKDFVTSKLRNILDQCQMYLKPSIASKSRSQQIATLYQMLSDYAHHHPVFVSKNPGFFYDINSQKFLFASSENSPFIQEAKLEFSLNRIDPVLASLSKNNYSFQIHSVEAAFLVIIRWLSLLMTLNIQDRCFHFPYLLVLSCSETNPAFFSAIHCYLRVFNKLNANIIDINTTYRDMQNKIVEYNNNILLLNAMTEASSIRNENLNLLRDHYLHHTAFNLCAVISNTIQTKLNCSEYLELHLENVVLPDTLTILNCFSHFDFLFINTICANSAENFKTAINTFYHKHLANAVRKFGQVKAQNTYAIIMAVKDYFAGMFFSKSREYFSQAFESFVSNLLSSSSEQISNSTIVKMFRSELESQLSTGKIRLFQNQKINQELPVNSSILAIFYENHTLLIPTKIFDALCSEKSVHVKRALYEQGYLSFTNQLYITKKIIYQPGSSGKRMDVYAIHDDLVDPAIMNHLTAQNRLQLSKLQTTSSSENGIVLGHGVNNHPIIWSYRHSRMPNAHMFITGRSGNGKTTFILHTIQELCKCNEKTVIFDISESYLHHPDEKKFADIYTDTFPVNPLYAYPNETKETCCQRVTDNLASVFHLDDKNYYILLDTLNDLYENHKINIDIEQVQKTISKNKMLMAVLKFAENFCSKQKTWEQLLVKGRAVVISMKHPRLPYEKATEFLLNDLYNYLERCNDKVFIVIDEIQNMVQSDTSAVIKVLSQGREKGLALIAATQSFLSIPRKYKSMFLQSGLSIFFQPEITAADSIAKLIHAENHVAQVSEALKKLGIAECLVYGSFENRQHQIEADTLLYCNCILEQNNKISATISVAENSEKSIKTVEKATINLAFEMNTNNLYAR